MVKTDPGTGRAPDAAASKPASDGMMVLSPPDLKVSFVNPQMLRLLNASASQVEGRTWKELAGFGLTMAGHSVFAGIPPEQLLQFELKTELKTEPASVAEEIETFLELDSYPVLDAARQVCQVVVIGRDISSRKRFEADLNRRVYERDVANEFSKALQRTIDINEVLYVTLTGVTAEQGLQFNRAFVLLYAPHTDILEGEAAVGPLDEREADRAWRELSSKAWTLGDLLSSYDSNHPPSESRISAQILRLRLQVRESDSILARSLRGRQSFNVIGGTVDGTPISEARLVETLGWDTFAVIPLYTRFNPIGVMVVDNKVNRKLITPNQIKLLEILAGHASSAVENSQLYKNLREQVRALEISRTALKDNQQRLLHAERLSTVGKMAATVAHEIRNPLVAIGGFARMLKQQIPPEHALHEDVEIILSETIRLEKIVTNILRYSYSQQAILQPADIHALLRRTLDMLRLEIQERSITVQTRFDPDFPLVEADQAQLLQAFYNLIINAIQALESGGTITIATEISEQAAVIKVRDTGCGIPQENLDKILKPFFTTKQSGAGLGLSVVADILDAHRGSIAVFSRLGEGTEFLIRLPVN